MPPALAQINKATPLIEVQNLTALLQTHSDGKDFGTPQAAMYQSQSGGIVDTLNKLLEDAREHLYFLVLLFQSHISKVCPTRLQQKKW